MCLPKDNFSSNICPKCFCSLTFVTSIPLKNRGGGGGMGYLFFVKIMSSMAWLFTSELNSISHFLIISSSRFKSDSDI